MRSIRTGHDYPAPLTMNLCRFEAGCCAWRKLWLLHRQSGHWRCFGTLWLIIGLFMWPCSCCVLTAIVSGTLVEFRSVISQSDVLLCAHSVTELLLVLMHFVGCYGRLYGQEVVPFHTTVLLGWYASLVELWSFMPQYLTVFFVSGSLDCCGSGRNCLIAKTYLLHLLHTCTVLRLWVSAVELKILLFLLG